MVFFQNEQGEEAAPAPAATQTNGRSAPATSRPVDVAIILTAIVIVLGALKQAASFFIPVVAGIFLAYALSPIVNKLSNFVRRSVAVTLVIFSVGACVALVGYIVWGQAVSMLDQLPKATPTLKRELKLISGAERSVISKVGDAAKAVTQAVSLDEASPPPKKALATFEKKPESKLDLTAAIIVGGLTATSVIGGLASSFLLAFFVLLAGDRFRRKTLRLFKGRLEHKNLTQKVLDEVDEAVQRYLGSLIVTNAILGVATAVALLAIGLQNALVWGALSALFHVIPYMGPILIAIGVFLSALVQWESLGWAIAASLITVAIAFLVGMVLQTLVMGRQAAINASAMFVGVLFFGWLWGAVGLLLAVPILVVIRVVLERFNEGNVIATYLAE